MDFWNAMKSWQKIFCFWDKCIWIYRCKFSLLWANYLWSAVKGLKNSPKIPDVTKNRFFELDLSQVNETVV